MQPVQLTTLELDMTLRQLGCTRTSKARLTAGYVNRDCEELLERGKGSISGNAVVH